MPFLAPIAPWVASALMFVAKHFWEKLFTEVVLDRIAVDALWYLSKKYNSDLLAKLANTAAKELEYGYHPEMDKQG